MTAMNLDEFCRRFQKFLEQRPGVPDLIATGSQMVGELVKEIGWFGDFLEKVVQDRSFWDLQETSIWANEISLYRSKDRSFSVLGYIWEPHTSSPIHDHGAWGIIGTMVHPVEERTYRRLDDGRREGFAELEEVSSRRIQPGETTHVLPLDEGIHRMGAPERLSITVNVYGKPTRRGYIQFFKPAQKTVARAYSPRLFKQVLAIRTLSSINEPWVADMLRGAVNVWPDYLKKELELASKR